MKLLIVTQTQDAAHPVLGFFTAWVQAFRRHASINNVDVIATQGNGSRLGRLCRFWRAVWQSPADVVLVHMTPVWVILGWPLWTLRRTTIALWYTHGSNSWALRLAVRLAHVTFTATKKAFPFTHPRVQAVGHGIAPDFEAVSRAPRPHGRFAFLAVGRVAPRKRVRETLAFFAQIHQVEPRATLDWIGPCPPDHDPYMVQVQHDMDALGIRQAVTMGSSRPAAAMPQVYATHDLLLHLSDTGSLDKVVVEALASGCPVFSTSPATAEALGERWRWASALNATAATDALHRVDAGIPPEERVRVGEAFALTALINRLVHTLESLV